MALLVACGAWLAGVGLALVLVEPGQGPAPGIWAAIGGVMLLTAAVARAYPLRLGALAAALALLGWARAVAGLPAPPSDPLRPGPDTVTLRGTVAAPAVPGDTWLSVRVAAMAIARDGTWEPADGLIAVRLPRTAAVDYGDALELRGRLGPPSGPPGATLRRQQVQATMDYPTVVRVEAGSTNEPAQALHALRRRLEAGLAAALPEPHAGLLIGFLLGGSAALPADFREAFRTVGLSHLVAVSGFNVTLVAGALAAVAGPAFGQRAGWLLAATGVVLYTGLVGAPPSALRAAAMALIGLAAQALGRPRDALAALAAAAVALTAWEPLLLADLGFQLSLLATTGLITLEPVLARPLQRLPAWAAEGVAATLAAEAFVLPLQAATFHAVSPLSPLANLLVVPLVPVLMALGLPVAIVGVVAPALAPVAGLLPGAGLEVLVRTVWVLAALPGARVEVGALPGFLVAVYFVALLATALAAAPEGRALRRRAAALIRWPLPRLAGALGVVLLTGALLALASRPEAHLRVAVLDVGQGDAVLVRTPSGRLALIDGGPSPATLLAHLGARLGFLERHLDLVVLTHPHEDHVAGLIELVQRYSVGQVVEGAIDYTGPGAERWRALVVERALPTVRGVSGQQWQLDDAVFLDVWAVPAVPGSRADRLEPPGALVLRLRYGATSLLLPGDATAEQTHRLLAAGADLRASALLVPHHGSRTGLDAALLAAVRPQLAAVSSGDRNRFRHPAPETLALLAAQEVPVWRTDRDGTVELASDGAAWTIHATGKRR